MRRLFLTNAAALACLCAVGAAWQPAHADPGPIGEWKTQDGAANIAIRTCGGNLCGYVSWAKEGSSFVGREVLVNMKPSGAIWSGTVVNVASGQKYAARMSLQSSETLKIEGCVLGGMICGGQHWSRVK